MTGVFSPSIGERIDVTSERSIFQLKLTDSLMSSLKVRPCSPFLYFTNSTALPLRCLTWEALVVFLAQDTLMPMRTPFPCMDTSTRNIVATLH
jgi:hypothetical protein